MKTTTELLLTAWDFDPLILAIAIASVVAYALVIRKHFSALPGDTRAAAPAAASRRARSAYLFTGSVIVFVVALASPIGVLSRSYLFSAHMLQHLLLVLVVPPLALLSLPAEGPLRVSTPIFRTSSIPRITAVPHWFLGVGAMWLWHAPTLCNAASRSPSVHYMQTISLVAMGAAFWWPIFATRAKRRLAPLAAMLYLFTACIACTVLGVLVTFSPIEVCSVYLQPVDRLGALSLIREGWGLTPKVDQEIGGLMMWVPTCIGYAVGILAMLARYYGEAEEPTAAPAMINAATAQKEEV